jgi:hypothetical protein
LENMCWRIWHLARKKKQVLSLSLSKYIIYLLRVSHWLQDNLNICL